MQGKIIFIVIRKFPLRKRLRTHAIVLNIQKEYGV